MSQAGHEGQTLLQEIQRLIYSLRYLLVLAILYANDGV